MTLVAALAAALVWAVALVIEQAQTITRLERDLLAARDELHAWRHSVPASAKPPHT